MAACSHRIVRAWLAGRDLGLRSGCRPAAGLTPRGRSARLSRRLKPRSFSSRSLYAVSSRRTCRWRRRRSRQPSISSIRVPSARMKAASPGGRCQRSLCLANSGMPARVAIAQAHQLVPGVPSAQPEHQATGELSASATVTLWGSGRWRSDVRAWPRRSGTRQGGSAGFRSAARSGARTCELDGEATYDRCAATCYLNGTDISEEMCSWT